MFKTLVLMFKALVLFLHVLMGLLFLHVLRGLLFLLVFRGRTISLTLVWIFSLRLKRLIPLLVVLVWGSLAGGRLLHLRVRTSRFIFVIRDTNRFCWIVSIVLTL
jgi:hypothetical protein